MRASDSKPFTAVRFTLAGKEMEICDCACASVSWKCERIRQEWKEEKNREAWQYNGGVREEDKQHVMAITSRRTRDDAELNFIYTRAR